MMNLSFGRNVLAKNLQKHFSLTVKATRKKSKVVLSGSSVDAYARVPIFYAMPKTREPPKRFMTISDVTWKMRRDNQEK